MKRSRLSILFLLLLAISSLRAQSEERLPLLQPADTLHRGRFWVAVGGGASIYTGSAIVLWHTWYKQYETTSFHLFNDWEEWEGIDKGGHLLTAYHEAKWVFDGAVWTGMDRRKAMWTGVATGFMLQGTIEAMDAFASKWGFSLGDIAFNSIGLSAFAVQEMLWEEQRIGFKVSFSKQDYPDDPIYSINGAPATTLEERARDLYGTTFIQRFFKDYNGHTFWMSINPASFAKEDTWLPPWLNIAVGYGAQNMYGGFANEWPAEDPEYILDPVAYPRYSQFYFSFDIDLTKIRTKSHLLRAIFGAVNFIKIPAPALEFNTLGEVKFHPIYW